MSEDVFEDNDCVVNKNTNRQRESEHRKSVNRKANRPHNDERTEDTSRNRQRDDQHSSEVVEENINDTGDKEDAEEERELDVLEGFIDNF